MSLNSCNFFVRHPFQSPSIAMLIFLTANMANMANTNNTIRGYTGQDPNKTNYSSQIREIHKNPHFFHQIRLLIQRWDCKLTPLFVQNVARTGKICTVSILVSVNILPFENINKSLPAKCHQK